ncbi:MAG: phosphatidylserine decarboxylase [bacterium]|nr:phosphatidylserine decarboxylase [bacterium]
MKFLMIFILSLLVNAIIFTLIVKKCEFRLRISIIIIIFSSILTGTSVSLVLPIGIVKTILFEFLFACIFIGLIAVYRFYRDPERTIPDVQNAILSPADGFVRYIKYNEKETIIGITLTYLDVHINRSPISGAIKDVKQIGEGFLSLKYEKGIKENRQVKMTIDNGIFKIGLTLVASRLVRKILVWVKEGQKVKQGDRIGKIVFGSQTDIVVPNLPGLKIKVKEKEQVYAGLTMLAEYAKIENMEKV